MVRQIIKIDEELCNGRTCAQACHEGAIGIVDGKAKLRDDYCDGLETACPYAPRAISLNERPLPFDEEAVKAKTEGKNADTMKRKLLKESLFWRGCPGSMAGDCKGRKGDNSAAAPAHSPRRLKGARKASMLRTPPPPPERAGSVARPDSACPRKRSLL